MDISAVPAATRDLVFRNLLNGVPAEVVAAPYRLSPDEVRAVGTAVLHKCLCYMHDRNMPYDRIETLADAKRQRLIVLYVLDRLNLNREPRYKKFERVPISEVIAA